VSAPSSDKAGIRQTIRALRAAGWELDYVWDREETIDVRTEGAAVDAVMAVDEAFLNVRRQNETGYVFFVLGNDPEEVICDHTINLSDVLDPLTDAWSEY
jgi:hypothetical protein